MKIEAERSETIEVECTDLATFQREHPGFKIQTIDDVLVVADCEVCDDPIMDGEDYYHDSEGVTWHKKHGP